METASDIFAIVNFLLAIIAIVPIFPLTIKLIKERAIIKDGVKEVNDFLIQLFFLLSGVAVYNAFLSIGTVINLIENSNDYAFLFTSRTIGINLLFCFITWGFYRMGKCK